MQRKTFEDLVNNLVKSSLELSSAKAHDYADEDVLANFKRVAQICQLYKINFAHSYQYAMMMCLMKIDRIQNILLQNKTPKNESLKDSIQDAFNYLMLMHACLNEDEETKE